MSATGINDLAAEILSYVFELRQQDVMDDARALLDLACVCKYWNETAFGHPQLWCNVQCRLAGQHSQAVVDGLERWVGRAGQLPLSLHVSFDDWPEHDSPMAAFIAGCSKWETLRFTDYRPPGGTPAAQEWWWMSQILRAGEERSGILQTPCWPILSTLELSSNTAEIRRLDTAPLPTRIVAPGVKSLTINCWALRVPQGPCHEMVLQDFSWSSLSSLRISSVYDVNALHFLVQILRSAANLERLDVVQDHWRGLYSDFPLGTSDHAVTPLKLQHLSLELDERILKPFFQYARFPALRSMQLRTREEPKLYSRFLKWSLEEQCKDPEFWPMLEHFRLILGDNVLELREGVDPGFAVLKQGPWTWWILSGGTP